MKRKTKKTPAVGQAAGAHVLYHRGGINQFINETSEPLQPGADVSHSVHSFHYERQSCGTQADKR